MQFDPLITLGALFVITQIIAVLTNVTTMRKNMSRVPPLDQEIYQNFATKTELSRLEGKLDALISSNNEALRDMTKSIADLNGVVREHLRLDGLRTRGSA